MDLKSVIIIALAYASKSLCKATVNTVFDYSTRFKQMSYFPLSVNHFAVPCSSIYCNLFQQQLKL